MTQDIDDIIIDLEAKQDRDVRSAMLQRAILGCGALLMAGTLVFSTVYGARSLVPWLLGYWNNDHSLQLTNVNGGACGRNPASFIAETDELCICGRLDTNGGRSHVNIHVQAETGIRIDTIEFYDQPSGAFCESFRLNQRLDGGTYQLRATPRLSNEVIAILGFRVQDTRPDL